MKNYKQLWSECLAMICEKVNSERVYTTWFADIKCDKYDEKTNTVTLTVPSKYVYEYLEQYCLKFLGKILTSAFGDDVQLAYRIQKDFSFADIASYLEHLSGSADNDPCHITLADAGKRLRDGLDYFVKDHPVQWLPAYDEVADWLTDNKGKGLLVVGTPGTGKTLICQRILPVLLEGSDRHVVSVNAGELHDRLESLLLERIVVIDDLGKEPRKHYGNIDQSFFELCNNAERTGQLLIITTNLSTTPYKRHLFPESIKERYGAEVLDRLKVLTSMVLFEAPSMRPSTEVREKM